MRLAWMKRAHCSNCPLPSWNAAAAAAARAEAPPVQALDPAAHESVPDRMVEEVRGDNADADRGMARGAGRWREAGGALPALHERSGQLAVARQHLPVRHLVIREQERLVLGDRVARPRVARGPGFQDAELVCERLPSLAAIGVAVVEHGNLRNGQRPARPTEAGSEGNRLPEVVDRGAPVAGVLVHVAELEQRLREVRAQRERGAQAALGRLELAALAEQHGDVEVHVGEARHELGRAAIGRERGVEIAEVAEGIAQVVMRFGVPGAQLDRAAQAENRVRHATGARGSRAVLELLLR